MGRYLKVVLQVLIVVCMVDGMIDGTLSVYAKAQSILRNLLYAAGGDVALPSPRQHFTGGVGMIVSPQNRPHMTVGPEGRRGPPPSSETPINRRILLLGASQAFGLRIGDDQTLAAIMQQDKPGWEILNYAAPGETLPVHWLHADHLTADGVSFDSVLVVNGLIDITKLCFPPPTQLGPHNAFRRLYDMIAEKLSPPSLSPTACATEAVAHRVARQVYDDMLRLLAVADARHVPMTIAFPPVLYDHPASLRSHAGAPQFEALAASHMPAIRALRRMIAEGDERRIVDMSRALDSVDRAYIDVYSHFSNEGSRVVARHLEAVLP